MSYRITVTVSTSRDPECNPFTYTEVTYVRVSQHTNKNTKTLIDQARENYGANKPYNINTPLVPIDVKVEEQER